MKCEPVAAKGYPISITWNCDRIRRAADLIKRGIVVTIEEICVPTDFGRVSKTGQDASNRRRSGLVPKRVCAFYDKRQPSTASEWVLEWLTAANVRYRSKGIVSTLAGRNTMFHSHLAIETKSRESRSTGIVT